jgi:uncharacterized protein YdhG (YjbR/CyaY superfamily)
MRIIGSMSESDARVDAYLAALPSDQRALLEGVRAAVRRLVPEAEDTISYDMPAFRLGGRFLVSYAGWKRHCSLYPLTDSFLAAHASELEGFGRTKGSIHFTAEKPLPADLLDDLIRARVEDVASPEGS